MSAAQRIHRSLMASALACGLAACGGAGGPGGAGGAGGEASPPGPVLADVYIRNVVTRYDGAELELEQWPNAIGCCPPTITMDREPAGASNIAPGSVVLIHTGPGNPERVRTLDVQRAVVGAVEAIDSARARLMVVGQDVRLTGATMLGDRTVEQGASLAELNLGDVVAVSGFAGFDGDVVATRIELRPGSTEVLVRGYLRAGGGHRFRVGQVELDDARAVVEGFPATAPVEGDPVVVMSDGGSSEGVLDVRVLRYTGDELTASGDRVHLRGRVTGVLSADAFEQDGRPVQVVCTGCSQQLGLTIRKGAFVTVVGDLDAAGSVVVSDASAVYESSSGLSTLRGRIRAVAASDGTFEILDFDATTFSATRFSDGAALIDAASLEGGDEVIVRGGAGGVEGLVVAASVTRTRVEGSSVYSGGFLRREPSLFLLGREILTTGGTVVERYCVGRTSQIRWRSDRTDLFDPDSQILALDVDLDPDASLPMVARRVSIPTFSARCQL